MTKYAKQYRRGLRMKPMPESGAPRTFDQDNREVLRQTRQIHKLEVKRRALKKRIEELNRELKGRRYGLREFVRAISLKNYGGDEFDSENLKGEGQ